VRVPTPALAALSAAGKGELLDELLTAQPALRDRVEALAVARMSVGDRAGVAEDVEFALRGLGIDEPNSRAGYQPAGGYVDPGEAADELLDKELQPFLDDLQRRSRLGMAAGSESLLEYSPDYVVERASKVVAQCGELGIELPADLVELLTEWDAAR
jgi:hypothetical protein